MLTTILTIAGKVFTGRIIKWLARRFLELGGTVVLLVDFLGEVDPEVLHRILGVLGKLAQGRFEEVSVAAVIGAISLIWGLTWNARSSFKKKPDLPTLTLDQALAKAEEDTGVKHTYTGPQ